MALCMIISLKLHPLVTPHVLAEVKKYFVYFNSLKMYSIILNLAKKICNYLYSVISKF